MIGGLLRRYRGRFLGGFLLLLATNGLALIIPLILKEAVESLRLRPESARVALYALLIAAVATVQALVRTGSRLAILGASRRIVFDLRNRFYAHLQRLPPNFYSRASTGDLMSRAVNDMMSVRSFFGPGVMNLANTAIVYAAALGLMFWVSPGLTAASLLPLPLLLFAVQRVSRDLYARSQKAQESLAALSERVRENLSGIHLIKTYVQEEREIHAFNEMCAAYRRDNLALARSRGVLVPLMGSVGGAGTLIVLWLGGRMVASGRITLGDFVAFSAWLGMLVWPTIAMGWVINSFQRGVVAMRRLDEVLRQEPEIDDSRADPRITSLRGEIEIRDLTLAHEDGGPPALRGVSLRIAAGEMVALVGPIGSGKSSVAALLPRFLQVPDGTVFLDGHDINRIPLRVLRGSIGYAPQEAFLFSRSLAENIAFGRDVASSCEVEEAARLAGLGSDLDAFPDRLRTRVGEGGYTLSGGQRQRAALARAVILDPRILILDDSLSSVDAQTEEIVLGGLAALRRGRTMLLISHRMAAAARADRIAVLQEGRIVEEGTHEELLARGGLYAEMSRHQALEREIEAEA